MKRIDKGLVAILVATLLMALVALPDSFRPAMPQDGPLAAASNWLRSKEVTLGLDLQGGTRLDYRVDLSNAERLNSDEDASNDVAVNDLVEGVLATLERRVNSLGVSEPQIYSSNSAGERHVIVELAGIQNIEEAKAVVGKTIQLEFKEPKTEADPNEIGLIREKGQALLSQALAPGADFSKIGEASKTADGKIEFVAEADGFESDLPVHYASLMPLLKVGEVHPELVEGGGEYSISEGGSITEKKTLRIVKLVAKENREKTTETQEKVRASHILIPYQGAQSAAESVTRSKEEAQAEAERLAAEAKAKPEAFGELAKQHSSDQTSAEKGGDLDFFGKGAMVPAFEESAFALQKGEISEPVETDFGFHVIQVTDRQEASTSTAQEPFYSYQEMALDITPDAWKATGLNGSHFKRATVTYTQFGAPQVAIEFDKEGGEIFAELTEKLVNKPLAIFVGGELISKPTVEQKIAGGTAVITGTYTLQEAMSMAKDLNTGAIDAPILLSDQYTISATLGESALKASLIAGLIGFAAVALFMVLYYRLLGLVAVLALGVYSTLLIFILKTTPLVMTLAGIAGLILSVGMAVDANILIFERTKEELKEGQSFSAAIAAGFERAWSSIRDSNTSSLITCAILWFFGNSIIRGFALMLALGILASMFTAITVTRSFIRTLEKTKVAKSGFLLGVSLPKSK